MDLEKIKALIEIVEASSLLEFSMEDGDVKIAMSRKGEAGAPVGFTKESDATVMDDFEVEDIDDELYITSPIVGTFYSASGPDIPAYVRAGDAVKKGETVCIIEAMKLMNELQCPYDCEIEAVLVSNEQKVEYGQPLFRVKKR
ncbi:acetyl-CoA carboxylase biotin carboxyl carrier protein [Tuanshanicoccus lijuaniae]|uniref:acetyl-CoA carboxylase biotin carboxyl carrier protein n=1 Tax=Aerococcaceae bacterium zg-1292 TaxID=2774330 RepID=UPI001938D6C3|nr:acetyl-CoA carboxylase biotin carboxyl carrier protein [Aerococcaceae bacterium zg-1292]MBF6625470.1 acetyl-CoA carboxylase biotin carboxyl carrier protein [Aerococcaceae bacterium zg-BR9]MBF6977657.1 acetyl-CoA carboxylase biotin carboxyl carrier protein [Aerococcaceae bacterium zg-BR22]MBS4456726.1 acetyl-CoA carboxylase biotin carboxyl carrier protein [Aerococcaceae bacterium zg-A91]MBS4458518.1 acetyl-CoA carboxylase biotin carboxyl carrier protein [Aerococcaceae bacterium zg-BR33]